MTFEGGELGRGTQAAGPADRVPDAALPGEGAAGLCWSSLSKLNSYVPLCK